MYPYLQVCARMMEKVHQYSPAAEPADSSGVSILQTVNKIASAVREEMVRHNNIGLICWGKGWGGGCN